jgi:predicted DCC family thiol-disulfide oxidoreductase YuxK
MEMNRGWILYDAECPMCYRFVAQVEGALSGFARAPLQSPWVQERLGLAGEDLLAQMRVLTPNGRVFAGADAVVYLAEEMCRHRPRWWPLAVVLMAKMPFGLQLLRYGYGWVAARRSCRQGRCAFARAR